MIYCKRFSRRIGTLARRIVTANYFMKAMLTEFYKNTDEKCFPDALSRDILTHKMSPEKNKVHLSPQSSKEHRNSNDTNQIIQCDSDFYKSNISIPKSFRLLEFEKRNLKCPQCSYITDRKNNLKRHIVTMHQECPKTLDCCGIVFRSKAALREHVSFHHRGGYRCQICGRNFCRKALLRRHLTVHSGQKDYRCHHCTYATSHKSNLERHQKVHQRPDGNKFHDNSGYDVCHNRLISNKGRNLGVLEDDRHWQVNSQILHKELYKHQTYSPNLGFSDNLRNRFLDGRSDFKDQDLSLCQYSLPDTSKSDSDTKHESDNDSNNNDNETLHESLNDHLTHPSEIDNLNSSTLIGSSWFYYPSENNFSSFIKTGFSSDDERDENQNDMNEISDLENFETNEEGRKHCRRLSQKPYKCSSCGLSYTNQKHFIRHGCGKSVRSGFYFSVTNMVKKGVALAEIKNTVATEKEHIEPQEQPRYTYVL